MISNSAHLVTFLSNCMFCQQQLFVRLKSGFLARKQEVKAVALYCFIWLQEEQNLQCIYFNKLPY